jgi:hypothetical protein
VRLKSDAELLEQLGSESSLRGEIMRNLFALAFFVMSLMLGLALTACSDDTDGDYYENDIHRGYPGPGATTPNSY